MRQDQQRAALTREQRLCPTYVLAVPVDLPLVEPAGGATRPDRVRATVPKAVWERRSCGAGTKGERFYDWAAVAVTVKDQPRPRDTATPC